MVTEIIEQCAYHESGRVAYAYQCGYSCESIELSEMDAGAGVAKLNPGADGESIQLVLKDKAQAPNAVIPEKTIDVAKKLMKIYCAASCAEIFFKEEKQIGPQTEIEIPGQDIKYINMIQSFLKNNVPNHPPDYPSQIITQVFRELKQEDNWRVIETLAQAILKTEEKKINRFYIEDALMKAGFKPERRQQAASHGFDMKVKEDETPRKQAAVTDPVTQKKVLDNVLADFLKIVKKDWTEEELNAGVGYLKRVFEDFR